jgi:hypothetical protein
MAQELEMNTNLVSWEGSKSDRISGKEGIAYNDPS